MGVKGIVVPDVRSERDALQVRLASEDVVPLEGGRVVKAARRCFGRGARKSRLLATTALTRFGSSDYASNNAPYPPIDQPHNPAGRRVTRAGPAAADTRRSPSQCHLGSGMPVGDSPRLSTRSKTQHGSRDPLPLGQEALQREQSRTSKCLTLGACASPRIPECGRWSGSWDTRSTTELLSHARCGSKGSSHHRLRLGVRSRRKVIACP